MQFADNVGLDHPAQCAGWSGPLLPAYWISGYCSICWRIENVQIRLHACIRSSYAHDRRAFFPHYAWYVSWRNKKKLPLMPIAILIEVDWLFHFSVTIRGCSRSRWFGCAVRLETRRSRVQPPTRSATFFCGDWSWNIFYGHSLLSADSRRAVFQFLSKECAQYWLTA